MGAISAWFTAVVLTLSLVVVLHQLGVDVSPAIGSVLHGVVQVLNRPLL
jgi:small basic protein